MTLTKKNYNFCFPLHHSVFLSIKPLKEVFNSKIYVSYWGLKLKYVPYLQEERGHTSEIFSMAVSYEGAILVTGSRDSTCVIWRHQTTKWDAGT